MIDRQMGSPIPMPDFFVVKRLSKQTSNGIACNARPGVLEFNQNTAI